AAQAGAASLTPSIDTHQHIWDSTKVASKGPGGKQYLLEDYLKAAAGLNIVRSVYMEVNVKPTRANQEQEAAYALGMCEGAHGIPAAAIIGGNPEAGDFRDYIMQYKDNPRVKGVRKLAYALADGAHPYDGEQYTRSVRLLGELGLIFEMTTAARHLDHAARLARACPGTRLVLDHCGSADPKALAPNLQAKAAYAADEWKRGMEAIAKNHNTVCKISGIVAQIERPLWTRAELAPTVDFCLDTFGPDRVVFGGDWPACTVRGATLRDWVTALREIIAGRPREDQAKLLHDNARRIYGLT
ncbi:MAG: amidohydrolase family protein, partial [bacterium]|nr:amidohydrolase family protein [bacterium]